MRHAPGLSLRYTLRRELRWRRDAFSELALPKHAKVGAAVPEADPTADPKRVDLQQATAAPALPACGWRTGIPRGASRSTLLRSRSLRPESLHGGKFGAG